MKVVGIYIQDSETLEYNRVDLFDDEKISVTSSIQNINDIAKTYTDFSNTYTVPATKQNNKIFKHWYDNSNDYPFSTLTKSNAYIEIDTIPFRSGKVQLESANLIDGQPQDYSITFIGILGNLKDTFAGKFLKDLTLNTIYDFNYTANTVIGSVVDQGPSSDVMWPLISSNRPWNFSPTFNDNAINWQSAPIRYNELFPAIRLRAVLNMIETQFGIKFNGIFLDNYKFKNAYLWLKNKETFLLSEATLKVNFDLIGSCSASGYTSNLSENTITNTTIEQTFISNSLTYTFNQKNLSITIQPMVSNKYFTVYVYKNQVQIFKSQQYLSVANVFVLIPIELSNQSAGTNDVFEFYIGCDEQFTFSAYTSTQSEYSTPSTTVRIYRNCNTYTPTQTLFAKLQINKYFPEIKIEDFFSGILKMFNLTCYSNDGTNYTVEQLENYYGTGSDIDITKYVLQDKKALNRVKTYKRINFEYDKSESFINVAFESNAGIPYGSLRYSNNPPTEGEEYSIKLPFEDLNFSNLQDKLQVGYALKTDYQKYIPKPVILYNYFDKAPTNLQNTTFYMSSALVGNGSPYTSYRVFGQESKIYNDIFSLNFTQQQSTLTNEIVNNSLYQQYYQQYFVNIYNLKARLVKVSAILPTSILTTLKLNDSIIIRDAKYLINTYTTNLTTGEVQFELLTEQRKSTTDVKIGLQTWTSINLDITTYNDGSVIPQALNLDDWFYYNTNEIGAWCYYDFNESIGKEYGKLYNGYAVKDTRGLAPNGYHIPTDAEWQILANSLSGLGYGGELKEIGFTHWKQPNTNANNLTNFSALGSGIFEGTTFSLLKEFTKFWTSTESGQGAYLTVWYLEYNSGQLDTDTNFIMNGCSIRLIKD